MGSDERNMDRRRFVQLLAAGAAAAATVPIADAHGAETHEGEWSQAKHPPRRAMSAAMRKEIESQKKSVADMLKVVRSFELPAGSPPATIFRALKSGRTR